MVRRTTGWPRLCSVLLALALAATACSGGGDLDDVTDEATDGTADDATADVAEAPPRDDPAAPTAGPAEPTCTGASDGVLHIGSLLPETGSWEPIGRAQRAAARLAVRDVNEAGGVLGREVAYTPGDEGDVAEDIAERTVEGQLEAGVDVIVGATSESGSLAVIDRITDSCVIQFSPANASTEFTTYDDGDLYFRTAPSNALQGQALAEMMLVEGNRTAAVLGVDHQYGEELRELTARPFEAGGGEVVLDRSYDADADDFAELADEVVGADPDALLLAGFDETATVLAALFERGVTPDRKHIYLSDSNMSDATGEAFSEPGALAGIKGTVPGAEASTELRGRLLLQVDPELRAFTYAPETYDAVVVAALAAEVAGSDDPAQVAREINGVTRDGEVCTSFLQCRVLVVAGTDIDYDGAAGPLTFSRAGDPTTGSFAALAFGQDNRIDANATQYHRVTLADGTG